MTNFTYKTRTLAAIDETHKRNRGYVTLNIINAQVLAMGKHANSPPGPTRTRSVKKCLDEFVEDHIVDQDGDTKRYRLTPATLQFLENAKLEKLPEDPTVYRRLLFFRKLVQDLADSQHYDLTQLQPEKIDKLSARKKTQLLKEAASQLQGSKRLQDASTLTDIVGDVYTSFGVGEDDASSVNEDFGMDMDMDMNDETLVEPEIDLSPSKNYSPVAKAPPGLQRHFTGHFTPPSSVRGESVFPELSAQPARPMITPARPSYNGPPLTPPETILRLSSTPLEDSHLSAIREEEEVIAQLREENEQLTEEHNALKAKHELSRRTLEARISTLEEDLHQAQAECDRRGLIAEDKQRAFDERVMALDQELNDAKSLLAQKDQDILALRSDMDSITVERDDLLNKCRRFERTQRAKKMSLDQLDALRAFVDSIPSDDI